MGTGSPVVLVDVDGVLNPLERPHRGYRRHRATPHGVTYGLWLNIEHGALLRALAHETGAELVWASYWRDQANRWISPRVGLPEMDFVPIPAYAGQTDGLSLGAWKARHVAAWARGRPFVWFEDEPDVTGCVAAEAGIGPHLIVAVDARTGLVESHVEAARTWLRRLPPA
jgi:hypothetical protein